MSDITFCARRLKKCFDENFNETMEYETKSLSFDSDQTAVIVSDMWEQHWCKGATKRVSELAPKMNDLIKLLRSKGVKIIFCPSGTEAVYNDSEQKKKLDKYTTYHTRKPSEIYLFNEGIVPDITSRIDPDLVQCDCHLTHKCNNSLKPWKEKGQIKSLDITEEDLIGFDNENVIRFLSENHYKCVFMMGVHTNMCVIYRKFGLKALRMAGILPVLVRDMTDCMIPREEPPYQDHFTALDHTIRFIEEYICPSTTSAELVDSSPFVFSEDKRLCISYDWGNATCGKVFDDYDLYLNRRLLDPIKIRIWVSQNIVSDPGINGIGVDYFGENIPIHGLKKDKELVISIPFGDYISKIVARHGVHKYNQNTEHIIYTLEFYGKDSLLGTITAGAENHFSETEIVTLAAPSNYRMNSIGGVFSPDLNKLNSIYFHSQPVRLFEIRSSSKEEPSITTDVIRYRYNKEDRYTFFINGCWRDAKKGKMGTVFEKWIHEDAKGKYAITLIKDMGTERVKEGGKIIIRKKSIDCLISEGKAATVTIKFDDAYEKEEE